jgi:hypothetical protein
MPIEEDIEKLVNAIERLIDQMGMLESTVREATDKLDNMPHLAGIDDSIAKLDQTLWRTGQEVAILRPARRPSKV